MGRAPTTHMRMRKYTQGLASFDIHWFWMHIEIDIGINTNYNSLWKMILSNTTSFTKSKELEGIMEPSAKSNSFRGAGDND